MWCLLPASREFNNFSNGIFWNWGQSIQMQMCLCWVYTIFYLYIIQDLLLITLSARVSLKLASRLHAIYTRYLYYNNIHHKYKMSTVLCRVRRQITILPCFLAASIISFVCRIWIHIGKCCFPPRFGNIVTKLEMRFFFTSVNCNFLFDLIRSMDGSTHRECGWAYSIGCTFSNEYNQSRVLISVLQMLEYCFGLYRNDNSTADTTSDVQWVSQGSYSALKLHLYSY